MPPTLPATAPCIRARLAPPFVELASGPWHAAQLAAYSVGPSVTGGAGGAGGGGVAPVPGFEFGSPGAVAGEAVSSAPLVAPSPSESSASSVASKRKPLARNAPPNGFSTLAAGLSWQPVQPVTDSAAFG